MEAIVDVDEGHEAWDLLVVDDRLDPGPPPSLAPSGPLR
jgi:hypothetical protein